MQCLYYIIKVVTGYSRLHGALRDSVSIRVSDNNIIIFYNDHNIVNLSKNILY